MKMPPLRYCKWRVLTYKCGHKKRLAVLDDDLAEDARTHAAKKLCLDCVVKAADQAK
jgi:hypothetical protein